MKLLVTNRKNPKHSAKATVLEPHKMNAQLRNLIQNWERNVFSVKVIDDE